jgi:hypothetical protein
MVKPKAAPGKEDACVRLGLISPGSADTMARFLENGTANV